MKAVIMAGGEGTRLRPLTSNQPKPMMPVANRPMMEHVVELLKTHGFEEIVVTVGFQANAIRTYFGNGAEFGVRMAYATEETPLGTAGSVRNAMDELDEPFLVISGDVLTDIDLTAVVDFHEDRKAVATIGLKAMENPLEFGIVITREDGSIERFLEKPSWGQVFSDTINTGIYVLQPEIFDYIEPFKPVDFSSDVFPRLLGEVPMYGYVADGYWEDIGTLDAYIKAHQDILDRRVDLDMPGFRLGEGIWLGEGSEIDPAATVDGPAIIGDYCRVEAGAHLAEYSILGSNVRVGNDAFLERSVVHDNVYLGPGVRLRGAVVGRSSDLRRGARIEEGVVIGDECFVGEHAVINPGVKVYPFKTVEQGAIVNSSIVWESRGARSLFGRTGVTGLANVDISPELAVRLAMAYGTTMKKGSTVVASRDTSRAARMLKRALMVGLNAAGVDVADLEVATVPVTRFGVRNERRQWRDVGPAGPGRPAVGGHPILRLQRDRHLRSRPEEDRAAVLPGGLPAVSGRRDRRHRLPGPYRRVLHRRAHGERRRRSNSVRPIQGGPGLRLRRRQLRHAQRALQARGRGAVGQSLRLDPPILDIRPMGACCAGVGLVRASGRPPRRGHRHRRRVRDFRRRHRSHPDRRPRTDGLAPPGPGRRPPPGHLRRLRSPCRCPWAGRSRGCATDAGADLVWTKLSTPAPHGGGVRAGRPLRGQPGGRLHLPVLPACLRRGGHPGGDAGPAGVVRSAPVAMVAGCPGRVAHEAVVTPWEKKGLVMRTVMEWAKDREVVLVDGVKILHDNGWALVFPDPEEPLTHVWAEAATDADCPARAQEYARRIRNLLRSEVRSGREPTAARQNASSNSGP